MSAPVDVLAVLDAAIKSCPVPGCSACGRVGAIRATVAELIAELSAAHRIIRIALNTLPPGAKRKFIAKVIEAGLDGEGITRANEREALLARCGGAS